MALYHKILLVCGLHQQYNYFLFMGENICIKKLFKNLFSYVGINVKIIYFGNEVSTNLYNLDICCNGSIWTVVLCNIQKCVIALDSVHEDIYKKNRDDYVAEIEQLHAYVKNRVNEIEQEKRILITAHDA